MLPLDRNEAAQWLEEYLRRAGVAISPELARNAAARFEDRPDPRGGERPGVNLLGLRTEVEKVLTARPGAQRWEAADLDQIISYREDHEISKLLEAIADRRLPEAIGRLRALLASKEPEALILWSIGDLFRQALKSASSGSRSGGRGYGGWSRPGGRPSTFDLAQRALEHYSPDELAQALRRTRDADLAVKSSWKDSKVLLEILIWQVTAGWGGSTWAEPNWTAEA
jgi:DNA polymerase III delta subunit